MSSDENKQLIDRLFTEVVNGRNVDAVDELVAENYVRHDPVQPEGLEGREGFKEQLRLFLAAFPDVEIRADQMIAEGDTVAARVTERGTHEGEFMGFAPTGSSFEISGIVMHRIENGRIAETWAQFDSLGLMQQLGLVESPEAAS